MKAKLVIFIAILIFIFWGITRILTIKSLECSDQFGKCDLNGLQEKIKGKSLFGAKRVVSKYLATDPRVRDFTLRYKPFNVLDVYTIVDVPKYGLKNEEFGSVALINEQGYVSSIDSESGVPSLTVEKTLPNVGDTVDKKTLFALEVYYRLSSHGQFGDASLYTDRLEVESPQGKIILPLEGDQEVLLGKVTLLLSRLKEMDEESKIDKIGKVSEIDLRFKNPIIR